MYDVPRLGGIYDTVDLYSRVNTNELLRLAFQAHDQISAFSLDMHSTSVVSHQESGARLVLA